MDVCFRLNVYNNSLKALKSCRDSLYSRLSDALVAKVCIFCLGRTCVALSFLLFHFLYLATQWTLFHFVQHGLLRWIPIC